MKIWESDITSFDKNINSILNDIAKELSDYFDQNDSSICVLWNINLADNQFVKDQLNFSKEDLEQINQRAKGFNDVITNKEFEGFLDEVTESPFWKIDKFYNYIELVVDRIKIKNATPHPLFGKSFIAPRIFLGSSISQSIFSFRDYYLDNFFSFPDEEALKTFEKTYSSVYQKNSTEFSDFFEMKKEEREYLFFVRNMNVVSKKRDFADIMAKRELIKSFAKKHQGFTPSNDEIISCFQREFLSFPSLIMNKDAEIPHLDYGFLPYQEEQLDSLLRNEEYAIILNAKDFLAYQFIIHSLIHDDEKRFHDYDFNYGYSEGLILENRNDFLVSEIMKLVLAKLEFIFEKFDFLINQKFESLKEKRVFNNEEDLIKYLMKLYKDIEKSGKYKIQFLRGIKLPYSIHLQILKCLQNLLEYKLAERESKIWDYLLVPSELEEQRALIFKDLLPPPVTHHDDSDYSAFPFSNEKIYWPEEKKDILIKAFNELSRLHPKSNKPIVNPVHVVKIMKANFSCFPENFDPKRFKMNGKGYWLYDFIFQLVQLMDEESIGTLGDNRRRLAQFIIQNFEFRRKPITKPEQFESVISDIRQYQEKKKQIRVFFL